VSRRDTLDCIVSTRISDRISPAQKSPAGAYPKDAVDSFIPLDRSRLYLFLLSVDLTRPSQRSHAHTVGDSLRDSGSARPKLFRGFSDSLFSVVIGPDLQ